MQHRGNNRGRTSKPRAAVEEAGRAISGNTGSTATNTHTHRRTRWRRRTCDAKCNNETEEQHQEEANGSAAGKTKR